MRALALIVALAFAPPGADAHGYGEFSPLDPALRAVLIDVLADTVEQARPDPGARPTGAARGVEAVIDALDETALAGLAARLRARAGVADPARLPDSAILPLFYDLGAFVVHYEDHGHETAAARADYRRLKAILEQFGGD